MRVLWKAALPLLAAGLLSAACTTTPEQTDQPALPPALEQTIVHTIDGVSTDQEPTKGNFLYPGRYRSASAVDSLDELLPADIQPAVPVIYQREQLDPAIRDLPTLGQRAIRVTMDAVVNSRPVNMLPTSLTALPKPAGAATDSEAIDEDADLLGFGMGVLYLEADKGRVSATILNAYDHGNKAPTQVDGQFAEVNGVTIYADRFGYVDMTSDNPGREESSRVIWQAVQLKSDCNREQQLRDTLSSGCVYTSRPQQFRGDQNVVLVGTVKKLERIVYQPEVPGQPVVLKYYTVSYAASMGGGNQNMVESLDTFPGANGYYPRPKRTPNSQTANDIVNNGGFAFGGDALRGWPAFALPG